MSKNETPPSPPSSLSVNKSLTSSFLESDNRIKDDIRSLLSDLITEVDKKSKEMPSFMLVHLYYFSINTIKFFCIKDQMFHHHRLQFYHHFLLLVYQQHHHRHPL